jgi:hypothetical protein
MVAMITIINYIIKHRDNKDAESQYILQTISIKTAINESTT